jgi:N utilization substance protein A
LDEQIEKAVGGYSELDGVEESLAEKLVGEGFLSYDDLSVIEPDALMEMGSLTEEQALHITEQAEQRALEAEAAAAAERRRQKELERIEAATREAERLEAEARARQGTSGGDGDVAQLGNGENVHSATEGAGSESAGSSNAS